MERSPASAVPTQQQLGGRFVLGAEVGRGGMAVVHRAHDQVLDREVAVKLLHPHLASDPAFLGRFRREARAAAGLAHPNIVAVHDWGEQDGRAFLVLQLVEGASLRDVLRAHGHLSPAEAMAVLVPAAAGLQAAHASGIVHRDVKPENLLIGRDGSVRVTDFGLARAAADATATFGPDVLVGSPHYLAPEAVRGEPLDPRADVYALGVLLFECLVGYPPHRGDTPYSTALAHLEQDVPAPSTRRDDLPRGLDAVVLAATRRELATRTPTAEAFGAGLRAAMGGSGAGDQVPSVRAVDAPADPHHAVSAAPANGPASDAGRAPTPGQTLVVPIGDIHTEVVGAPRPATPSTGGRSAAGPGSPAAREGGDSTAPGPPPPPRRSSGRRRRRWPVILLLLLGLVGASAAGGYLLWDRVLAPVTPIPSVVGAPGDSGVEQLERAGFEPEVTADAVHDRAVPAGHVLSQDPQGTARSGTEVSLVLSAGPRQVEVPDLAGLPVEEAAEELTGRQLRAERRTTHHPSVPQDAVIATEPAPGRMVDEGSEVTLSVSLGPTPIPVPTVTGQELAAARDTLADLDLDLEVVGRRYDGDVPSGHIISQQPAPETVRFAGDSVEVVVSDGPEPITLPNVRGERVADAVATLEALGFEVAVERRGGFSAFLNPDRVYDQDPGPDSTRLPGATVQLYAYEP